ncbi:MAG: response regulator [Chloroflexi bacterium]|nr:response regulator [Chloroflexota bacterium]
MYLEDELGHAQLIDLYVSSYNHILWLANTTEEAFELLNERPDIILVDVMLHHTRDGLEFIRTVRREGVYIPIVVITALSSPADQDECQLAGANAILIKPITMNQLDRIFNQYGGNNS